MEFTVIHIYYKENSGKEDLKMVKPISKTLHGKFKSIFKILIVLLDLLVRLKKKK